MNKPYFQLQSIILFVFLLISVRVMAQTVYTPKGTAVPAQSYSEFTAAEITNVNNLAAAQFPSAQRLDNSSRTYNCHAYAWYLSESPGSTRYWIETPGDDAYWNDGSYIQICNESQASKISYANDDHSAIRSVVAGKYDSKWGQWPLMRHNPTETPYVSTNRKYYVPTKINAVSTTVCGSGTTFSVASITSGTYTWSSSTNVSLSTTSGNSVTATATGNGIGWVQVIIGSPCSATTVTNRLSVNAGPYIDGTFTNGYSVCSGYPTGVCPLYTVNRVKTGTVTASLSTPGISTYTWAKTSSNPSNVQWGAYSNGTRLDVILNSGQSATFNVSANTGNPACNTIVRNITFYHQAGSFLYAVSPNPASSDLTVTAQKAENKPAFDESIQDDLSKGNDQQPPSFEVSLYDQFGQLVEKKTNADKGLLVSFDVQSLRPGRYVLRIVDQEQSIGRHIIIE